MTGAYPRSGIALKKKVQSKRLVRRYDACRSFFRVEKRGATLYNKEEKKGQTQGVGMI